VADLKGQWKKKGKEELQSVKTPKQTEEKATLKGTIGMAHLCGSMR
jgi:hypothetical protein